MYFFTIVLYLSLISYCMAQNFQKKSSDFGGNEPNVSLLNITVFIFE